MFVQAADTTLDVKGLSTSHHNLMIATTTLDSMVFTETTLAVSPTYEL
jgi:hypothetical protein